MTDENAPFAELPAALVEDVLAQTRDLGDNLLGHLSRVHEQRASLRERLAAGDILRKKAGLPKVPSPTTCAADGSYVVERLMTVDLAIAAAIAVEGLTPPSEARHWPAPRHKSLAFCEQHSEDTATILRAAMMGEELALARAAPHNLTLLDGTLALPIIYFNQGFSKAREEQNKGMGASNALVAEGARMMESYAEILECRRSDKQYAGVPKYSTKREVADFLKLDAPYDDRGLLTLIMEPGEYTNPLSLEQPPQPWHLGVEALPEQEAARALATRVVSALENLRVFYYKPYAWLPALRVEIPLAVAGNDHRLATVLQGLEDQCAPSMLEPFPLHMADRFVKALSGSAPAFRHIATQRVAEGYQGKPGEIFFAMHGFRSEKGR